MSTKFHTVRRIVIDPVTGKPLRGENGKVMAINDEVMMTAAEDAASRKVKPRERSLHEIRRDAIAALDDVRLRDAARDPAAPQAVKDYANAVAQRNKESA